MTFQDSVVISSSGITVSDVFHLTINPRRWDHHAVMNCQKWITQRCDDTSLKVASFWVVSCFFLVLLGFHLFVVERWDSYCLQGTFYRIWDTNVSMHHVKFLIIKQTRCTDFSNLFLEWDSTCFGQFLSPSSGVFLCTHSSGICHTGLLTTGSGWNILILLDTSQQTCMTYTIAVCTEKNSWWWTEELSETCRVSFQE
jgi:hypothetical protein